jgi:hypothetical protein
MLQDASGSLSLPFCYGMVGHQPNGIDLNKSGTVLLVKSTGDIHT